MQIFHWFIETHWYFEVPIGWMLLGLIYWICHIPKYLEFGFFNMFFFLVPSVVLGPFAFVQEFIGIL